MNQPSAPTDVNELLDVLRQMLAAHQQIAHALADMEALLAEEAKQRVEDRKVRACEQEYWKQRQQEADEKARRVEQECASRAVESPALPWIMRLICLLAVLTLGLASVCMMTYLIGVFWGKGW